MDYDVREDRKEKKANKDCWPAGDHHGQMDRALFHGGALGATHNMHVLQEREGVIYLSLSFPSVIG